MYTKFANNQDFEHRINLGGYRPLSILHVATYLWFYAPTRTLILPILSSVKKLYNI
jgi:hypothetical protein